MSEPTPGAKLWSDKGRAAQVQGTRQTGRRVSRLFLQACSRTLLIMAMLTCKVNCQAASTSILESRNAWVVGGLVRCENAAVHHQRYLSQPLHLQIALTETFPAIPDPRRPQAPYPRPRPQKPEVEWSSDSHSQRTISQLSATLGLSRLDPQKGF